jgi:hypothetical protein
MRYVNINDISDLWLISYSFAMVRRDSYLSFGTTDLDTVFGMTHEAQRGDRKSDFRAV